MTLIGWIVFGLVTGFVASRIVNQHGQGCILNVVLGIVGAFIGGFIFASIGRQGITGFNVYSMPSSVRLSCCSFITRSPGGAACLRRCHSCRMERSAPP
jgi:uncharacterized membrane protein YeaQ/YmgE (transglycosylase-associated protein family)